MHSNVPSNDLEHSRHEEAQLRRSTEFFELCEKKRLELEETNEHDSGFMMFIQEEAKWNWTKDRLYDEFAAKLAQEQIERVR
jgi:hypothetical protein